MAGQALSAIGVVFGYGLGTLDTPPTTWTEIEECVSIGGVSLSTDTIDVTPLKSKRKKYINGHEDTGGTLSVTFNESDTFDTQWDGMLAAYESRENKDTSVMWFCAYHPTRTKMSAYIVVPASRPKPEYTVGSALQVTIENTIVDLPDDIEAKLPTV